MKAKVHFDGASRGNPGDGSCAAVVEVDGRVEEVSLFLGQCTNNQAEYCGLIAGLETSLKFGAREIELFSDSIVCVKQVLGEYKVKSDHLAPLHMRASRLLAKFAKWSIQHVPREENERADFLSNLVLDLHEMLSETH